MSEWHPSIVEIKEIEPHENADKLGIVRVLGNYPVCVALDSWQVGDFAAYIPVDTLVPNAEPFKFLFKEDDPADKRHRVRAKKLRGVFSMGLLVPVSAEDDVSVLFGLEKWEPELKLEMNGNQAAAPELPVTPPKYDVEGLRANAGVLSEGEHVYVTEKIHGANMRVVFHNEQVFVGGRNTWQDLTGRSPYAIAWSYVEERMLPLLQDYEDVVFYGEVFGKVQDLRYGLENDVDVLFFDAFDGDMGCWFSPWTLEDAFRDYNVTDLLVPQLYVGPYSEEVAYALAEGPAFRGDHMREGVVIRPHNERWDDRVGRVLLKLVGEGYQTR